MTEAQLQNKIFSHHWNNYPNERGLLFAVNQNAQSAAKGALNKAIGVVPGVSDMIYLGKPKPIFIELKANFGKQSLVQSQWQKKIEANGYIYVICKTLEDFLIIIE